MGYTTDFNGKFVIDKKLDDKTKNLINGLSNTRRVGRDTHRLSRNLNISYTECLEKYGKEGEFYYDENDFKNCGQTHTNDMINYNTPPFYQPSLWCQWKYNEENNSIVWDQNEKFYEYIPWIKYLVKRVFEPNNYKLNGEVKWFGEEDNDRGIIIIENNNIKIKECSCFE